MHYKHAGASLVSVLTLMAFVSGCNKEQAAPPPAEPAKVSVVTQREKSVNLSSDLPGRTNAYRMAEVRPQVDGIVLKRLFKEGSDVKAGQQLYQIDQSTYEATLASVLS
ncbi:biotin/lipoyl-binding protein, partial [Pseudomonas syringae group genomosp. 3]|uniref:biotin/lipoyl-binding protein n=1 Tax=Pseudomonas syringae group genomosp. 3 TaxID=251701 RepID=UPI000B266E9A